MPTAIRVPSVNLPDGTQAVKVNGDNTQDGKSWEAAKANLGSAVAALKQAFPAGGGKIILGPGQFTFTSQQLIDLANVTVQGAGIGVTTLVFTGSNYDCVAVTAAGVELRDLTIDARSVTGTGWALNVTGATFVGRRVSPRGHAGAAFSSSATGSKWVECDRQIAVNATDCVVSNGKLGFDSTTGAGRIAVLNGAHRTQVIGNYYRNTAADNTTACGIEVQASDDVSILNNDIDGCPYHGIFFNGQFGICNRAKVMDNTVRRPGRNRTDGDGTVSCYQLNNVQDGECANNYGYLPPGYGIFGGGSDGFTVVGTIIRDNHIFTSQGADPCYALRACERFELRDNAGDSGTYGFTLGEAPGDAPVNNSKIVGNTFRNCNWGGGRVRGSCNNLIDDNEFIDCGYDNATIGWAAAVIYNEADGGTHPTLTRAGGGASGNRYGLRNRSRRETKPATNALLNQPRYLVRSDGPNSTHPIGKSRGNIVEYSAAGFDGVARGIVPATANPASMVHQNKLGPGDFEIAVPAGGRPHAELILDLATGGSGGTTDATTKVGGTASWRISAAANTTNAFQVALPAAWKTGGATPLSDLPDDAFFEIAVLIDAAAANFGSLRTIRFAVGSGDDTNVIQGAALTAGYIEAAGTWQILRARKGDLALSGTATWDNVNWFRPQIVGGAGGVLAAFLQNLSVVRTG